MNEDKTNQEETMEEENFAELLEQSLPQVARLEAGQKMEAVILSITEDWIFLDVGQKSEGVVDKKELLDAEGNLTVSEGQSLAVYFLSRAGGELRFTTRIGGAAGMSQLEEAWRSGIPVDGLVVKEIKGGFEVRLPGNLRAFCPYSQMDLRRVENPEELLEKHFDFKISQFGEKGRNIVLSRRVLLEEERRLQRETLKETLREGAVVKGTVTSVQDFGAFIDIGGLEGLLPISEIGWGRVENIREALSAGQEVEVAVTKLDWENERFSFSLKATLADPWEMVAENYPEGSTHTGRVARLTTFGAFVTLGNGVDGLIHISKLGGGKKIHHPREAVKEGQSVEVKVEAVDAGKRRISLSLLKSGAAEELVTEEEIQKMVGKVPQTLGTLGDLLKKAKEEKGRK